MAAVFLALVSFSASRELHGDLSSGFGAFFGFMKSLWRPFFCLWCLFGFMRASWRPFFWLWLLFRLHEGFMAIFFLALVPFSAS
ncbi:hypothetical protein [Cytobacillus oceanisediminis]|uniref:hypothetical protein n=1 Tax=Cytobacillus oceanisediminis TaxID=665099 RepID=UPI001C23CF4D|nr:hypothetical protein [Cytobacillus oceanisediminis]MBU8772955.1 hypothetical protein [Cytobacillus oceanisediminis]